ncbi:hypothetical protein K4L44_05815 [Halosquirtibacter laminarini]|uniref:Uncharacterized protein n=1 Tax=Halosquirtibacter laminarini TaxID=3374600 RepID=A0AC61NI14_9BACT|nr:hypothetical protein K4L44_05815 [Prolixibacteraceae bacterium]
MNFGLKYHSIFSSKVFHKEYEIRILKRDYTGDTLYRSTTMDGAILSKDSATWIKGTSLKFTLKPQIEGEFQELYTEDSKEFKVQLLMNGQIIWQGFILSEQYQEKYTYMSPVTITASDGVGLLKELKYHTYSTFQNHLATMRDCLKETLLELPFSVAIDLTEDSFNPNHSPLVECYDNPKVREDTKLDCYKVLEDILSRYDAELTQLNGQWQITRSCDKLSTRKVYDFQGLYLGNEEAPKVLELTSLGYGDIHVVGVLDMSMTKAMKSAKIEETLDKKNSILPPIIANNGEYAKGWFWNHGGKYKPTGKESFGVMRDTNDDYKRYLKVTQKIKATSLDLLLAFKFGLVGNTTGKVFIQFSFKPTSGNRKWLSKEGWKSSASYIESQEFSATPMSSVSFYEMKLVTDGFNQDGEIELRLYGGKCTAHGNLGVSWSEYKDISVTFIKENNPLPKGFTYHFTVNENATGKERTCKYLTGDAPSVQNIDLAYRGYTTNNNHIPTKAWSDKKLPNKYPLSEILGKMITSRNRKARVTLKGDIRGIHFSYSRIIQHQETLFEVASVSHDLYKDKATVLLVELLSFENRVLDYIRTETKESTGKSSSSGTTGGGASNQGALPKLPLEIDKDNYIVTSKGKTKAIFADHAREADHAKKADLSKESEHAKVADNANKLNNKPDTYFAEAEVVESHMEDTSIHTSTAEKNKWNKASNWIDQNTIQQKAKQSIHSDDSAKLEGKTSKQFIRKDINQEVQGQTSWKDILSALHGFQAGANGKNYFTCIEEMVRFLRPIVSSSFVSGFAGEGMKIDIPNASLELDNLTVRKSATFYEIVIQKLRAVGGMVIISPASMKVSKVTEGGAYWRCYFDTKDGDITNPFVVNDLVRLQTFGGVPRYLWSKVTSIGDDYIHLSKAIKDGNAAPIVGDDLVLLGNTSNQERQNAIILSATGSSNPVIDLYSGINSFSLHDKLSQRMGNLSGIVDPQFGALQGYGLFAQNVYLKGHFALHSGEDIGTVLSSKASTTYVNGKIQTTNKAITDATAAQKKYAEAEANAARVKAEAHADGKVSEEEKRAIKDAETKLQEAKQHAEKCVGDIEIGGRNLIELTRLNILSSNGKGNRFNAFKITPNQFGYWRYRNFTEYGEGNYSISFNAKSNIDQTLHIEISDITIGTLDINSEWRFFSGTRYIDRYIDGNEYRGFVDIICKGEVIISDLKVEKGNKATVWTPTPEDIEKAYQEYVKAKAEAERVKAEAHADGKVSDEEKRAIKDAEAKASAALANAKKYTNTKTDEVKKTLSTKINQTKEDITLQAKRITETNKAITEANSQININSKAITSKVSQTEVNKEFSKTNKAITDATAAQKKYAEAEANAARVKAEAHADGKVSDEEKRAIKDAEAKLQEAKQHAEKCVGDIEIGGRNLIELTRLNILSSNGKGNRFNAFKITPNQFGYWRYRNFTEYGEGNYSISFNAKSNIDQTLHIEISDITIGTLDINSEWRFFSGTRYIDHYIDGNEYRGFVDIICKGEVIISDLKVEKGNKATVWTPTPEDIEKAYQEYVKAKAEAERVKAEAHADGKVSEEEKRAIKDAEAKANAALANAKKYTNTKTEEVKKTLSTEINQTKEDISLQAKRITETNKAITEANSQININSKAITSKVSQTEVNKEFSKTNQSITDAIAAQKKYAETEANAARVKAEAHADGKVSDEEKRAIKDAEAKLQEAKQHAEKCVGDIEIGGRNLLLNSQDYYLLGSDYHTKSKREKGKLTILSNLKDSYWNCYQWITYPFNIEIRGKTLVLSCEIKLTGNWDDLYLEWDFRHKRKRSRVSIDTSNHHWQKVNAILDVPIDWNFTSNPIQCISGFNGRNVLKDSTLEYRNYKLEFGNKATDWTPAPEDINDQIQNIKTSLSTEINQTKEDITLQAKRITETNKGVTSANSKIQINTKAITSKVEKGNIVSTINQSAEAVRIKASKIEVNGQTRFASGYKPEDIKSAITSKLGSLAYASKVSIARLDNTIIDGGYIKTSLIKTKEIHALGNITAGSFNLGNGKFIVTPEGQLTAQGANIIGDLKTGTGGTRLEVDASKNTLYFYKNYKQVLTLGAGPDGASFYLRGDHGGMRIDSPTDSEYAMSIYGSVLINAGKALLPDTSIRGRLTVTQRTRSITIGDIDGDKRIFVSTTGMDLINYHYIVLGSIRVKRNKNWDANNDICWTYGERSVHGFYLYLRAFNGSYQDLYFDFIIIDTL